MRRILQWAATDSDGLPTEWRTERPYVLARESANWSGRPDPYEVVEERLHKVLRARAESGENPMAPTAEFLDRIEEQEGEFVQQAIPHLRSYLPEGAAVAGQIALVAFLPAYAFAWGDGTIVISVTDRIWANRTERLLNTAVHELFHGGFVQFQPGSAPSEARDIETIRKNLEWRLHNEGLATYVAYRFKMRDATVRDYRLLDDPVATARLFEIYRAYSATLDAAGNQDAADLRTQFAELGPDRVFYVVGAAMARRIESRLGKSELVATIERGPREFILAYRSTAPTAQMSV